VASIRAWSNEPEITAFLKISIELPEPAIIAPLVWEYLGLFRPTKSGKLGWGRAARLIGQVSGLIRAGHIQIDQRPARPASPDVWREALERMTDCPPKDLPLTNHNYFKKVAFGIADTADRAAECRMNRAERRGNPRREPGPNCEQPERISMEELKAIREKNLGRKAAQ
jgi:hypothetical protein